MKLSFVNVMLIASTFSAGCATIVRHPDSGYGQRGINLQKVSSSTDEGMQEAAEISKMAYEFGINPRSLASIDEAELVRKRWEIRKVEMAMSSPREVQQYNKVLPLLESDSERYEFLKLGSYDERQRWLGEKQVLNRSKILPEDYSNVIANQDIAIGMSESWVKQSWGEPDGVEYSGNPAFRNQRWKYSRTLASVDGYKTQRRIIYFEAGKVVGWETEDR